MAVFLTGTINAPDESYRNQLEKLGAKIISWNPETSNFTIQISEDDCANKLDQHWGTYIWSLSRPMTDWERKSAAEFFWSEFDETDK